MVQSQIALGFFASAQDEAIVACYARYAKIAYIDDKRFKSIPDCDRRFSPNDQVPFEYIKTASVGKWFNITEKGNNLDFYSRQQDYHNLAPVEGGLIKRKRQVLLVFRGTDSLIDLFADIKSVLISPSPVYQKDGDVAKQAGLSGIFGNQAGGEFSEAVFPAGFYDRAKTHLPRVIKFLKTHETWRNADPLNHTLEIKIAGHSLGASVSQVMGIWLMDRYETQHVKENAPVTKVEAFAFNPPKTANPSTRDLVKRILDENPLKYRMHLFLNAVDPVSRGPGLGKKPVYNHTINHRSPIIAQGTPHAYTAITWGKAAVNAVDRQDGFDQMEPLYENGCYLNFPLWPWSTEGHANDVPCLRGPGLIAHSLEQWFPSGWTDDSIPTYRNHLSQEEADVAGSNTIRQDGTPLSFF